MGMGSFNIKGRCVSSILPGLRLYPGPLLREVAQLTLLSVEAQGPGLSPAAVARRQTPQNPSASLGELSIRLGEGPTLSVAVSLGRYAGRFSTLMTAVDLIFACIKLWH